MEVLGGARGAGAQSHQCFGEVLPEGQRGPGQQFAFIWEGQTGYHFPRRVWQGGYPSGELFATWNKIA